MKIEIIQLIAAFIGSIGFCLLFKLRKQLLIPASLGAVLCWGSYLAFSWAVPGLAAPNILAGAVATLYAEILARRFRTPATLFCYPALIPLVPGRMLFNTMMLAVDGDWTAAQRSGFETLICAVSIAIGMSIIWAMMYMLTNLQNRKKA